MCAGLLGLAHPSPGELRLSPEEVTYTLGDFPFEGDRYALTDDVDPWDLDDRAVVAGD